MPLIPDVNPSLDSVDDDLASLRKEAQRVKELDLAERQARIMARAKEQQAKNKKYDDFMDKQLKCAICWEILVQPRM
ncbi:hypothetical protein PM082_004575 [Marasmius tenuissimus]|nr:hypothetical protein PM082_004575 [Marasmius tenuissimus]